MIKAKLPHTSGIVSLALNACAIEKIREKITDGMEEGEFRC